MHEEKENPVVSAVESIDETAQAVMRKTDNIVAPYRETVLKKFPILFTLLVTFGVAATIFGFEGVIMKISWLHDSPFLVLSIGLSILVLTGTLYKKLG